MRPDETSVQCPFSLLSMADVDPFASYEVARERGPVLWDADLSAWVVLDYADCVQVETDETHFSNPYAEASSLVVKVKGGPANITLTQGERHDRLRRFHLQLLSPKAVAVYRDQHVKPIIGWLLDRIRQRGDGKAELVAELAEQIPPRVIAALFGMPWQDDALMGRILHCHEEIMAWVGLKNSGETATRRAVAASDELNAMLLPYIRDKRERPTGDFISRVWTDAPEYYGVLEEEDALGICREIFLGGSDTTVHGISNALYLVLTDHNIRAEVERDRDKALYVAVEEAMRLFSAVQYRFRIARQDCRLGSADIRQGQTLVLVHAAANRDPARYGEQAAQADPGRHQPTDHLAFGRGPRACVGAGLARREMFDAVSSVLDSFPGVRLDTEQPVPRFASLFMRSFKPLHVRYDARPAEGQQA